jgi:hypothetical protein
MDKVIVVLGLMVVLGGCASDSSPRERASGKAARLMWQSKIAEYVYARFYQGIARRNLGVGFGGL